MDKKRVAFVIHSMSGGGAERVLSHLVRHLNKEKYDVSLVLFEKKGPYLAELPNHARIYNLNKKNKYSFISLVIKTAKTIRDIHPETVVSFSYYTNIIVGCAALLLKKKHFRLVLSERSHLSRALMEERYSTAKRLLSRISLRQADIVVVNSSGSKKDLEENFCPQKEIRIIKNPLDIEGIDSLSREENGISDLGPYVLAVGRLSKPKGYPYLLRAYALICQNIVENLVILGDGENKKELLSLVKELGVQDRVFFLGFQQNPYKFMKHASLYVLSSLWEGFPNVLLEAMACGAPVISTDCPSGPNELIVDGLNGILVPPANHEALAQAMLMLLRNENLKHKFSVLGRKTVEDFRMETVIPQFEEVLSGP